MFKISKFEEILAQQKAQTSSFTRVIGFLEEIISNLFVKVQYRPTQK